MSNKDKEKPEWLRKYELLSDKIDKHRTNAEKLQSEIQELERKLGYKR